MVRRDRSDLVQLSITYAIPYRAARVPVIKIYDKDKFDASVYVGE